MRPGLGWKLRAGSSAFTRHFDHVAPQRRQSRDAQLLAGRHADLLLHQIHAGDHLRHRVLDLDARVHFHEVERAVGVEQHLDRAGADVVDGLGAGHRGGTHLGAQRRASRPGSATPRSASGGGAAPSSPARPGGSRGRAGHRGSGIRCAAAARDTSPRTRRHCRTRSAPPSGRAERRARSRRRPCATRIPLPPPPAAALMITGKPICLANASASSTSSTGPGVPGMIGTPTSTHRPPGGRLVAHHPDLLRRGPDEGDVRRRAGFRELGVLGEEAVPGMDGVGAGDLGGGDEPRNVAGTSRAPAAARCRRRRRRIARAATRGPLPNRPRPSPARARGRPG